MSDKMTGVELVGVRGAGLNLWGDVEPLEAIEELRKTARRELEWAQKVLAAADEDFMVETFRGPYARANRRQVWPR